MANPTPGDGSLFKVTISASPTTIAKITKFGPISQKRNEIDFTGLADTFEAMVAATIKRSEPVAFEGWWDADDSTHAYLQTSIAGALTEAWSIVYANTGACALSFSGFLLTLVYGEANIDGLVPISGTIRPTTVFTVTP